MLRPGFSILWWVSVLTLAGCVQPTAVATSMPEATKQWAVTSPAPSEKIALVQTIQAALAVEGTPSAATEPEPVPGKPQVMKGSMITPPTIEPFDPKSDRGQGVATLKTLAEGWEGKKEPGFRQWTVSILQTG